MPPRAFDWDEAGRLRDEGLSYPQIAARLGVTHSSVIHALNPERRAEIYAAKNARKRLERAIDAQTRNPLRCSSCKREKPDEEFPRRAKGSALRRGRAHECNQCASDRRRLERERKRAAIIIAGCPECSAVGCFHSATATITYGTFRNWISLPARALSKLGAGVPLCPEHYATATFGNATPSTQHPHGAPKLERIMARARAIA